MEASAVSNKQPPTACSSTKKKTLTGGAGQTGAFTLNQWLACVSRSKAGGCISAIVQLQPVTVAVSNHRQLQRDPKWKVETSDCRSDRQASDQTSSLLPSRQARKLLGQSRPHCRRRSGSDQAPGRPPLPQIHITDTNPQRQKNKRPSAHQPSGLLPGPTRGLGQSIPRESDSSRARVHIPRIPHLVSREMDRVNRVDGVEMPRCFPLPRKAWADPMSG